MGSKADVVIVGAGVIGCAIAYFLSKEGVKVLVLEQDAIGSGASGSATGMSRVFSVKLRPGPHFQLTVEGAEAFRKLIPDLMEETGRDVLYQKRTCLMLALDEDEEKYLKQALSWQGPPLGLEWRGGEEVLKLEPRFNPQVRGAVYDPTVVQLDSYQLTLALAQAVERRGGEILTRQVLGLQKQGDRVTGVVHRGGVIPCDRVVIATGAWSGLVSSWLWFKIPVRPLRGERLMLRFPDEPLPVLVFSPRRGHMVSRRDGFLSVGTTGARELDHWDFYIPEPEDLAFDTHPTEAAKKELVQLAIEVMPCLEEAQIVQQLVGLRPMSVDGLPIIGPVPGWQGVYLATGHGDKGIHLCAITAQIISDLLLKGASSVPVPLEPFLPARFAL